MKNPPAPIEVTEDEEDEEELKGSNSTFESDLVKGPENLSSNSYSEFNNSYGSGLGKNTVTLEDFSSLNSGLGYPTSSDSSSIFQEFISSFIYGKPPVLTRTVKKSTGTPYESFEKYKILYQWQSTGSQLFCKINLLNLKRFTKKSIKKIENLQLELTNDSTLKIRFVINGTIYLTGQLSFSKPKVINKNTFLKKSTLKQHVFTLVFQNRK